jgi:hemerythrin superfamily protein
MKATQLLKRQHKEVERLFKQFEKADADEQVELFEQLAAKLVAHDEIEREIFYPACAKALDQDDRKHTLGEAVVEHGVVEFCLYQAERHRSKSSFAEHVTVLKEVVQHHVQEEEEELLPKVDELMDKQQLDSLGEEMQQRFDDAVAQDYRPPLRAALDRVLSGRATRNSNATSGRRKSSKPARNGRRASTQ